MRTHHHGLTDTQHPRNQSRLFPACGGVSGLSHAVAHRVVTREIVRHFVSLLHACAGEQANGGLHRLLPTPLQVYRQRAPTSRHILTQPNPACPSLTGDGARGCTCLVVTATSSTCGVCTRRC